MHHFCCSIDLKSIKLLSSAAHAAKLIFRYMYPFFGTSSPELTASIDVCRTHCLDIHSPAQVVRRQEQVIAGAFRSFDFASRPSDVFAQFEAEPIRVDVLENNNVWISLSIVNTKPLSLPETI